MSVAYYLTLDVAEPGFDTFVNGKSMAQNADALDLICEKLEIPQLDDFLTLSDIDLSDMLGEEFESADDGERWFSAEEGLAFVDVLTTYIQAHPLEVRDAAGVVAELAEYAEIFGQAKAIGARWQLNLDI